MKWKNSWFKLLHNRADERGNILFIILIAVALFGSLTYVVSESSRDNLEDLKTEQNNLLATEILEYANIMNSAVSQLRLRDCLAENISFENPRIEGYVNTNNLNNETCFIFSSQGGGIQWLKPTEGWLDTDFRTEEAYANWLVTAQTSVGTIGTPEPELVLLLPYVNREVCISLNEKLSLNPPEYLPPQDTGDSFDLTAFYTGDFNGGEVLQDTTEILNEVQTGCFEGGGGDTPVGSYYFYKVLISR